MFGRLLLSVVLPSVIAWAVGTAAVCWLLHADEGAAVRVGFALAVVTAVGATVGTCLTLRQVAHLHAEIQSRQDRRNQLIVDAAADAIITFTHAGQIESFNAAAARLFGYTPDEVIGRDISSLIGTGEADSIDAVLRNAVHTGSARVLSGGVRFMGRHKDGRAVPIELGVSKVLDEDRRVYIQIIRDLSERERAERELREAKEAAEAASRAKSEFLANVSHEIRTPLNGIIGLTDLLLADPLPGKQRDHLALIQASGETLLALINDLLDFAKIEAARMTLEQMPFALRAALRPTLETLGVRAAQKGLRFERDLAADLPEVVVGDPLRLQQVLLNLVGNAIKFTPSGTVTVRLAVAARSARDVVLEGEVRDTGVGIAAEARALIFEAFRQADASRARRFGGTGLGLSITSRLLALMGGKIWVESTPGQGSTFHFTATLGVADRADLPPGEAPAPPGEGLRVLVAEDNPVNRELLVLILQKHRHRVTAVATGPLAVEAASREAFDVVLMDMQLPELDGLDAARLILAHPMSPPIIGLTASATDEERVRSLAAGMKAYLAKPIHPAELLRLVEEVATS